ncbi:MAG: hypothetical protein ACOVMR_09195 [Flavobacteriales bacterium]
MKRTINLLALLLLSLIAMSSYAQTNSSAPQILCVGSVEPYQVDYTENGGAGTTGSTYVWTIITPGFTGTISTNQGPSGSSNRIEIDWGTTPPGTYILQVIEEANGCPGDPIQLAIQLDPEVTPTFAQLGPFCQNSSAPGLPTTSNEGIIGTWSPASISTATAGTFTFTFTPNPGQCALPTTMDITIDPEITPAFAAIPNICQNSTAPTLPTTSTNGVTGTWSPATINTAVAGTVTYTFTPTAGLCAVPVTLDITIDPEITATFAQLGPLCQNSTAPALPTTSQNGITGTWSPSAINTSVSGTFTFTFTPDPGQCALGTTMTIVIDTEITPVFTQLGPYCQNAAAPTLPTVSNNGITGAWSPSTVDTATPGTVTYTFTPDPGQCAIPTTMVIVINPLPVVDAGVDETICDGESVTLTATGASTYAWSPATGITPTTGPTVTANPTSTTTYTVTGTDANGCVDTDTIDVIVNPTPTTSPIFHN